MTYTEAVVLESVRMFVSRTFGLPHRARRDTKLQNYNIPKVDVLILYIKTILHMDEGKYIIHDYLETLAKKKSLLALVKVISSAYNPKITEKAHYIIVMSN